MYHIAIKQKSGQQNKILNHIFQKIRGQSPDLDVICQGGVSVRVSKDLLCLFSPTMSKLLGDLPWSSSKSISVPDLSSSVLLNLINIISGATQEDIEYNSDVAKGAKLLGLNFLSIESFAGVDNIKNNKDITIMTPSVSNKEGDNRDVIDLTDLNDERNKKGRNARSRKGFKIIHNDASQPPAFQESGSRSVPVFQEKGYKIIPDRPSTPSEKKTHTPPTDTSVPPTNTHQLQETASESLKETCHMCPMKFANNLALMYHLADTHYDSELEAQVAKHFKGMWCGLCSFYCTANRNKKLHLAIVHPTQTININPSQDVSPAQGTGPLDQAAGQLPTVETSSQVNVRKENEEITCPRSRCKLNGQNKFNTRKGLVYHMTDSHYDLELTEQAKKYFDNDVCTLCHVVKKIPNLERQKIHIAQLHAEQTINVLVNAELQKIEDDERKKVEMAEEEKRRKIELAEEERRNLEFAEEEIRNLEFAEEELLRLEQAEEDGFELDEDEGRETPELTNKEEKKDEVIKKKMNSPEKKIDASEEKIDNSRGKTDNSEGKNENSGDKIKCWRCHITFSTKEEVLGHNFKSHNGPKLKLKLRKLFNGNVCSLCKSKIKSARNIHLSSVHAVEAFDFLNQEFNDIVPVKDNNLPAKDSASAISVIQTQSENVSGNVMTNDVVQNIGSNLNMLEEANNLAEQWNKKADEVQMNDNYSIDDIDKLLQALDSESANSDSLLEELLTNSSKLGKAETLLHEKKVATKRPLENNGHTNAKIPKLNTKKSNSTKNEEEEVRRLLQGDDEEIEVEDDILVEEEFIAKSKVLLGALDDVNYDELM